MVFSSQVTAFQVKKSVMKKVNKELLKVFDDKDLLLTNVPISEKINTKLHGTIAKDHLNKITKSGQLLGYAYIAKAPSKTDQFDYLILLDENLIIQKAKILIYREDYGGEIGSKRWLKQFIGMSTGKQLKYSRDVIAISGATISARSMTIAVNNFLKDITILKEHFIL